MKIIIFLLLSVMAFGQNNLLMLMDDGVSYEAETEAYIARVEADGGTIIDADYLNARVILAKEDSTYYLAKFWVHPKFGVKKNANNKVTTLYDIYGNDATQADTAKSPTWYTDSLAFDGGDNLAVTLAMNQPYSYLIYAKWDIINSELYLIGGQSGNGTFYTQTSKFRTYAGGAGDFGASDANLNTFLCEYTGAASKMYLNNTIRATSNIGAAALNSFKIGSFFTSVAYFDGCVKEIMMFNSILSSDRRTSSYNNMLLEDFASNEIFDTDYFDDGIELASNIHTPFSNFKFLTNADYIDITANSSLYAVAPSYSYLRIMQSDTVLSYVQFTDGQTKRITLNSGTKTIEITESGTSKPSGTQKGVYITSIKIPTGDLYTIKQDEANERLVFVGNSITIGDGADYLQKGFPMLFRDSSNYTNVYGWGYGGMWDMAKDSATAQATVNWIDSLADGTDSNKVIICLGTNDYGLNKMDSSDFADDYAFFLYLLNKQRSDIKVFAVTPLIRTTETANAFGNTLDDYREAIGEAASGKAYVTVIDGKVILEVGDLADNVHPSQAGHLKVYEALKLLIL